MAPQSDVAGKVLLGTQYQALLSEHSLLLRHHGNFEFWFRQRLGLLPP